jgi:putative acetyltransferase
MTKALIRRIDADDAPACAAIVMGWITRTNWMPAADFTTIEDALRSGLPLREAWGISEPLQGYLSLNAQEAHIGGFYVDTPGQGLGRKLMEHVKQNRNYLKLHTHAANLRAHAFYQREGFVRAGKPWLGEDGIDEIKMEWRR